MDVSNQVDPDVSDFCHSYRVLDTSTRHREFIDPQSVDLSFFDSRSMVRLFIQEWVDPDLPGELIKICQQWRSAWDELGVRTFVNMAVSETAEESLPPLWEVIGQISKELLTLDKQQVSELSSMADGWLIDENESGCYLLRLCVVTSRADKEAATSVSLSSLMLIYHCQKALACSLNLILDALETYPEITQGVRMDLLEKGAVRQSVVQTLFSHFNEQLRQAQRSLEKFNQIEKVRKEIATALAEMRIRLADIRAGIKSTSVMMLGESRAAEKYYLGRLETFTNYIALAIVNESFNPVEIVDPDFLVSLYRAQFQVELTKPGKDRNYMALYFGFEAWKTKLDSMNENAFRAPDCAETAWKNILNSESVRNCFGAWGEADPFESGLCMQILQGDSKGQTGRVQVLIGKLIGKEKNHVQKELQKARSIVESKGATQEKKILASGLPAAKKVPAAISLAFELAPTVIQESVGPKGRPPRIE